MKKRILALLLSALMLMVLVAGCGEDRRGVHRR